MSRANPIVLTGIFLGVIAFLAGLPYLKGGLYLDSHEADVYHLMDILFRMLAGQVPHLDFTTPLGLLTFFPIVEFLKAGLPMGKAFMAAQLSVAVLLLPIVVYAASTRLTKPQAIGFGVVVFGLVLTYTFLHASSGVTVAMHYNRWSWAVSFVALLLAFCPPQGGARARPVIDGVLIGLLTSVLLLTKITFFVALLPAIVAALLVRKQAVSILAASVTGVLVVALTTFFLGIAFWTAYIADLLNVTGSEVRPNVGRSIAELLSGPHFIGVTLTGVAVAMLIRRAGHDAMGLVVFALLFPGFIFISYQNFGNDPTWLLFLFFLVLVYRPDVGFGGVMGIDLRAAMSVLSLIALLINLPSLYTTAMSPIANLTFDQDRFMPFLNDPAQDDFFVRKSRANQMSALIALDDADGVWQKYREDAGRSDVPEVAGVRFPMCELAAGSRAYVTEIVAQLKADAIPNGSQFFSTGLLSAFWLYGDFEPLQNGAPWYYGDLTGIENADFVLIPKCVFVERVRRLMIAELQNAQIPLTLLHDNALYALYATE